MKGRKPGQVEISVETMQRIVELTEKGLSRSEIASEVGRCKNTVYLWQKKLVG